ncbi:MAG: hypothetical protein WCY41_03635 [Candidatus Micrarchaeia archaeon]
MRFEFAALLLTFSLLLAGCIGNGGTTGSASIIPAGNGSAVAGQGEASPAQPAEAGTEMPVAPSGGQPAVLPNGTSEGANASAPAAPPGNATANATPAYVDYCYPTYWKGMLEGSAHNGIENGRCGDYNYSMEISVRFTVPFDLAAYLEGKDFNFKNCPNLPAGAENGSRDMSIDGRFNSTRTITSPISGLIDMRPDTQVTSEGAMYISEAYGLEFAAYPRQDADAVANGEKQYPHLVASRCTWEDGIDVRGYDEAVLLGADAGGSNGDRVVSGKWTMNGTMAGNYTLERTN